MMVNTCGEGCQAVGVYCMVPTNDDNTHLGDHKVWSTDDPDEPYVIRWPNNPRNLNVWRTVNCRP